MDKEAKLLEINEAWVKRDIEAFEAMLLVGAVLTGNTVQIVDEFLIIGGNIALYKPTNKISFE
jgi:hypothetical protein